MSNQLATTKNSVLESVTHRVRQFQNNGEIHFPANYSPENALKAAWLVIQETKDRTGRAALEVCTKESVANAMLNMVIQGLSPVKKQAYFIVYGNQLQLHRAYFGTMAVCKSTTGAKEIFAEVVYKSDEFEFEIVRGKKIVTKHVQKLDNINKSEIIAAYCTIIDKDEKEYSDIMTLDEIKTSWKKSKMGAVDDKGNIKSGSTHSEFTSEMCKKTVINRACKAFINSSDDNNLVIRTFNQTDDELVEAEVKEVICENANQEVIDVPVDIITNEGPETTTPNAQPVVAQDW